MAHVLAIANRKGGSGKTTTAVNLAAEAAAAGLRTLVVDLDTQGHSGLGFGVRPRRGQITVHHLLLESSIDARSAILESATANVSVMPADALFGGLDGASSPSALARRLRGADLAASFDFVVIDTPPSYDALLVNALAAADSVLVPMVPHALSAEGVRQFARVFFRVATTINSHVHLVGLVPVMVNERANHHRQTLESMTHAFGKRKILNSIRNDIQVAMAFSAGIPLREFAPNSRGASDYKQLFKSLPLSIP